MRGKAAGALVGEGAGCLSLSLSRAAAVDEDAEAPRFVVDDVAEELGRIGTCLGVVSNQESGCGRVFGRRG